MDERLDRLAKSLASALGASPGLRTEIQDAIARSSYPESKVEFASLVHDQSTELAATMNAASSFDVAAALDSIVALELYFPVPAHRAWTGDTDLLVASLLSDDFDTVSAFDLNGTSVPVSSIRPPETPTLVLVPAETDFSETATESGTEPRSEYPIMSSGSSALRMTSSYVTDTHEHWTNGSPEIAVHIATYDPNDSTVSWVSCAGDGRSGAFHFDQNDNSWSGDVTIASQSTLEDETFEVFLWEDDWDRCDGSNYLTPNQEHDLLDQLTAGAKAAVDIYEITQGSGEWYDDLIDAIEVAYELVEETTNDDLIGVAEPLAGNCYDGATGAQEFTLRDLGGTYKGNIDLVNDFAERVKCPFEVDIQGPSEAQPNDYCTWSLAFEHGTGPYDIEWSGIVSGSGSSVSTTVTSSGWVSVSVTDANDESDGDDVYVTVDYSSQQCLI